MGERKHISCEMAEASSFPHKAQIFDGSNYSAWSVKMRFYLKSYSLWEDTENDREIASITDNSTVAQIKVHDEKVARKDRALSVIHSCVTDEMFNRIMTCETAKEAWDTLEEEFQGDLKARQMEILNLKREMTMLRMKDGETVKGFADRVMKVVTQLRMLGEELKDAKVVETILVSLPKRFEQKISSLEDSKDLTKISLSEFLNALHAVEQR